MSEAHSTIPPNQDFPLDGDQVQKVAGMRVPIYKYSDILKFPTIEDLLNNPSKACIILYEYKLNEGHWTCVFISPEGIEHFDSLGYEPDDEFKFIPLEKRKKFGEIREYLRHLLYYAPKELEINYNDHKLQEKDSDTCGRWVGYRLRNRHKGTDAFAREFEGVPVPDDLIIKITNRYLK